MGCTSRSVRIAVVAASMAWLTSVVPALAQHEMPPGPESAVRTSATGGLELPKYVADPIPLFSVGLGTFTRKISSTSYEAQKFFDQGFQMMYSFAKLDAVRSFRESWKRSGRSPTTASTRCPR